MGFFAGLNDEKYDRQYTDRDLTRRMVNYFNTQTRRLGIASIVIILLAVIGAALPVVVSTSQGIATVVITFPLSETALARTRSASGTGIRARPATAAEGRSPGGRVTSS